MLREVFKEAWKEFNLFQKIITVLIIIGAILAHIYSVYCVLFESALWIKITMLVIFILFVVADTLIIIFDLFDVVDEDNIQ